MSEEKSSKKSAPKESAVPAKEKAVKVEIKYDESEFGAVNDVTGTFMFHPALIGTSKNQLHLIKCRRKTCQVFDVPAKRIREAYSHLNGRKIDGIEANFLIGRYGFEDGVQMNRAQVAARHGKSVFSVELAHDVLKDLLHAPDVKAAYREYINGVESAEVTKKFKDMIETGE